MQKSMDFVGASNGEAEQENQDDCILMTKQQGTTSYINADIAPKSDQDMITTLDMHLTGGEVKQHDVTDEETNA
ncbi:hypothetical protein Tco_0732047 [Tanacetum coccineum]